MTACSAGLVAVLLLAFGHSALAAISSENNGKLKATLQAHPNADGDKNGVLSYAEYQAFLKAHPPKQANGQPLVLLFVHRYAGGPGIGSPANSE